MARQGGLGRGLGALIPPRSGLDDGEQNIFQELPIGAISPNQRQPRTQFDEEALVKWPTAGFMNLRMHLDHMFSGEGLRWLDFDDTHRFGQRNGVFRGLSDHVPIVGTFTFT